MKEISISETTKPVNLENCALAQKAEGITARPEGLIRIPSPSPDVLPPPDIRIPPPDVLPPPDIRIPSPEWPYPIEFPTTDVPERLPDSKGYWDGLRGHSKWIPDPEYVPLQSNPDGKDWETILHEYQIDGINFRWNEPDFREVSKGDVTIEEFSKDRMKNFSRADKELAQRHGCTPAEVRQWRHEHGYTWHECRDMKTMQKVPSIIHNNVAHSGGIARIKIKDLFPPIMT